MRVLLVALALLLGACVGPGAGGSQPAATAVTLYHGPSDDGLRPSEGPDISEAP